MNKQMQKWILNQIEDSVLINWAIAAGTKVKGFREITKSNIKHLKPQIINELLKQTKAMRLMTGMRRYISKIYTEDDLKNLREKQQDELLMLINNDGLALVNVLLALLTGEDTKLVELAENLFITISNNGGIAHPEPLAETPPEINEGLTSEETINKIEKTVLKLEEQISQEKEKNIQIEASYQELRAKKKAETQEWNKERKMYTKEIKAIKNDSESKSKTLEQQEVLINELRNEINKLQEKIIHLTRQVESKPDHSDSVIAPTEKPLSTKLIVNKPKVILLGESINTTIMNTPKFDVELIPNSQIEDFLQNNKQAEEIWMLTFQIPPQKQRKVRSVYHQDNFIEFANITELQTYIDKR